MTLPSRHRCAGWAGALAALALGGFACADPPAAPAPNGVTSAPVVGVRLSWVRGEGAEGCPDEPAVARRVAEILGYDPFTGPETQRLEAFIARRFAWRVEFRVRTRDGAAVGEHALPDTAEDCDDIAEAAAVALALAVNPQAETPPRPALTCAPPTPATLPAPPPPPPPPPPAPDALSVVVRAGAYVGLLPAPTFAVGAMADARVWRRIRWAAEVFSVSWVDLATGPQRHARLGAAGLRTGPCVRAWERPRWSLDACATVSVADVRTVTEYRDSLDRSWVALGASAELRVRPAGPLVLSAGLTAGATLLGVIDVASGEELHRTAPVVGAAWLGAGVSAP